MLNSPVEEIKSKLNVTEVLSDYLEMKKSGTNFKAICPFHSEKTPSFMISPAKQIWHCFGCGLGGDIFEFIKLSENIEFGEALKILADRAGIELVKPTVESIQANKKRNVLYEINQAALEYYQKVLTQSSQAKEALSYLKDRGLTDQTIQNWQLGFAPDDFHYLENFLSKTFNKKDIEETGLIIKRDQESGIRNQESGYFDRFRDRIMFPIINLHGQVVGFTARLLHEKPNLPAGRQVPAKYINSPESSIYNKSKEIYGLFKAKNKIRQTNQVVLVEGNMDVIASHQAGVEIAIASSGTAMTEVQINILKRFCENLIFAFDTDSAGLQATRRALDHALNLGFNVKIVDLEASKDPDELIKKGIGLWQKAIDRAQNFVDFFFTKTFDQFDASTPEGKRAIVKELAPLIFQISDPITKAHYIRKMSTSLNVAESVIWDIINKLSLPRRVLKEEPSLYKKSRREILEDQILGLTLNTEKSEHLKIFLPQDFNDKNRKLFTVLVESETFNLDSLKAQHYDLAAQIDMLQFATSAQMSEQKLNLQEEIERVRNELKKISLKEKMEKITQALKSAEIGHNKELAQKLSLDFTKLSNQINQYNN
ncbi:MAG: DNA primase [bacterium]|nr:DNA primase [bacterium]